jgi:hypothetical protein
MITERKYKNALAVVEQYRLEQSELQKDKLSNADLALSTTLQEVYDKKLITSKLAGILRTYHKYNVLVGDNKPPTLEYFTSIHVTSMQCWGGVGKKTLREFIDLMAAVGHRVKGTYR